MVSSSWLKGIAALLAGVLPLYWQPGLEAAQNSIMLPREAIPAITNPAFVSAEQASFWMDEAEGVIGLDIGGDARAYLINMLSRHEIVDDTVGGVAVAVTW